MILETKQMLDMIEIKSGIKSLLFTGYAVGLEDLFNEPRLGLINSLSQPTWQAGQKALEAYARECHEPYVYSYTVDSLSLKLTLKSLEDKESY